MTKKEAQKLATKYTFRTQWSEEDQVHVSHCFEFPSLSAHGSSPEKALKEIQEVVTVSLIWMTQEKEPIPEPLGSKIFSGKYLLRMPPELHRELTICAAEQNVSLNQYIQIKLAS